MHNQGIIQVDPKCYLGIGLYLTDINFFQLLYKKSEMSEDQTINCMGRYVKSSNSFVEELH